MSDLKARLVLEASTQGDDEIIKLRGELDKLKDGADQAGPELAALAAEIGKLGQQQAAIAQFERLKAAQAEAAALAHKLQQATRDAALALKEKQAALAASTQAEQQASAALAQARTQQTAMGDTIKQLAAELKTMAQAAKGSGDASAAMAEQLKDGKAQLAVLKGEYQGAATAVATLARAQRESAQQTQGASAEVAAAQRAFDGLKQSAGQAKQALAGQSQELQRARDALSGMGLSAQQLAQAQVGVNKGVAAARGALADLGAQAQTAAAAQHQAAAGAQGLGGGAQAAAGQVSALGQAAHHMAAQMASAFALREIVGAAAAMETLQAGLAAVVGDAGKAAKELDFVRVVASRIGAEAVETGKAFLSLAASTKGTAVEGQATREVFEAVATAMGKAGKSSADTSNALMALGQMSGKGVVQAEELVGQLSEALPGALQAAARGMGITVEELKKLVEQGRITATDVFPALTKGLNELYGQGTGAQTLAQEFVNIKNAFTDMSSRLGESGGLNALKVAAEMAQMAIVLLGEGLVTAGQKLGVLMGAVATMDFSRVREEFASIEKASQTSILKAAEHNQTLRASLQALNPELGQLNGAAAAAGVSLTQAGNAAQAAGAQATASSGDWIRLQNGYQKVLDSIAESITLAQKNVAAREAEGKATLELVSAFGTEEQQRTAAAAAARATADASQALAQAHADELATLQAKLASMEQELAASGSLDEARRKQVAELKTLIELREQEAQKAAAQARSAAVVADAAAIEARAHQATAKELAAMAGVYLQAQSSVIALREAQAQGLATAQQVADAEREAARASKEYSAALTAQVDKIRSRTEVERSGITVQQAANHTAIDKARYALEVARASGDEAAAGRALVQVQRLEAQASLLAAQAKTAEAKGTLEIAQAKKAALVASGTMTEAQAAEADAAIATAQAYLTQARAAEELAKKKQQLAGATGETSSSADAASESLAGMGDAAKEAGEKTAEAAAEASQSADALVSMWWRGENGASKYAEAVNKAMWETVRFRPQTEAGFAAMSAQANMMIETLEGIDAAQQALERSAQGTDAALADMRLRLLEIDGTEEEIAAAKMERERNAIAIEIKRLELEMERARLWKDRAQMDALSEEIAKQKELLNLLGQVEEKEKRKRREETTKKKAQDEDRRKRDEEAAKQRAEDERRRSQDTDKQKNSDRSPAYLGEDPGKSRSPTAPTQPPAQAPGLGGQQPQRPVANITINANGINDPAKLARLLEPELKRLAVLAR